MGGGVSIPVALSSAQKEILEGKYQLYQSRGCDDAELEGMLAKRLPGIVLFDQIDADHSGSISRAELKAIIMDQDKPIEERFRAQLKLAALPRNSAKNRIRNRCEVTGRPRAYYRKLKMSRVALRELGNNGLVPGLVKSSW